MGEIKTKHTALPWVYHSGMIWKDGPDVFPKGNNDGIPIAHMDRDTEFTQPSERDANAAFLTKAANAHYRLMDALKALHSCHRAFSSARDWTLLDDEAREQAENLITELETGREPDRHFVSILFGSEAAREEHDTPQTFMFKTAEEKTAFLDGVEAANGWLDYEIVADSDDLPEDAVF